MNSSLFGRLSPEIRNQIYELALPTSSTTGPHPLDNLSRTSRTRNYDFSPPLTRTCRHIRAETLPLFFANNTFTIIISGPDTTKLERWLKLAGPKNVRMVKGLDVLVQEKDFLMLIAVNKVVEVLGPVGIKFRVRMVKVEYPQQPGRRAKGHGRIKKSKRGL